MRKTNIIIALVATLTALVPVAGLADGMPPGAAGEAAKGSARTGNRVTMADLAADAPDQYTVVKGDTLWGIAGRFLKEPWRWPEIWEMNKDQIKDPHWIYPGDVVRLDRSGAYPRLTMGGAGSGGSADAAANVVKLEPRVRAVPLESAITTIPASAIGPFLTQPLVVEAGGLDGAPTILATEESRVIIGVGDLAYADRLASGDAVNWQVFRPGSALRDPESGEILGYEARYVGDARVRRFGSPSTLEITKARQEINRGDRLAPAREAAYPSYAPRAPGKAIRGAIMSVDGGVSELGQYQVITLNRGSRDGLEVGHVLATYRRGALVQPYRGGGFFEGSARGSARDLDIKPVPVVPDPPNLQPAAAPAGKPAAAAVPTGPLQLPDERTGLVLVFRVFEKMSYAMVMRATKPIYVNDVVQTP